MRSLLAFTPRDRLLLLAPHPDDEALATGGLLQRAAAAGASVRVIFLTDGDKNPWPQRVVERRWRIHGSVARARWGALRQSEALAALSVLGHRPGVAEFWSWPDQGLTHLLLAQGAAFIERLSSVLTDWQPTWLAAPSASDRHPDHSAVGVATALALRQRARSGDPIPAVLAYIVHGSGRPEGPPHLRLSLADDEVQTKRRAILCHRSQTLLSRGRFLAHAQPEEIFLPETSEASAKGPGANQCLRWARGDAAGVDVALLPSLVSRLLARRELHVLAASETNALRHLRLTLPPLAGFYPLRLPPALAESPGSSIFIKLKTARWLYDPAGWLELGAEAFEPASVLARAPVLVATGTEEL